MPFNLKRILSTKNVIFHWPFFTAFRTCWHNTFSSLYFCQKSKKNIALCCLIVNFLLSYSKDSRLISLDNQQRPIDSLT